MNRWGRQLILNASAQEGVPILAIDYPEDREDLRAVHINTTAEVADLINALGSAGLMYYPEMSVPNSYKPALYYVDTRYENDQVGRVAEVLFEDRAIVLRTAQDKEP